jgi:hypothetical protein
MLQKSQLVSRLAVQHEPGLMISYAEFQGKVIDFYPIGEVLSSKNALFDVRHDN